MKTTHLITIALCAIFTATPLRAAEEKEERIKVEIKIPDTADALWAEIEKQRKALADAVAAKKKDDAYRLAETVEALVKAIPTRYPKLATDNERERRVQGQVKNTARVLDELHDAMDAVHTDEAAKRLAQVETALTIIKSQVER